jgi:hypothetical protein
MLGVPGIRNLDEEGRGMIDWLWNNRTWLFSGTGISALILAYWIIRKLFFRNGKADLLRTINQNPTISQSPIVNQSPVINISNSLAQPKLSRPTDPEPIQGFATEEQSEKGGRPDIFTLPAGVEDLSAESFHGAVEQLNREHISTYLARFKLAANDQEGVGHELTASIEYVDKVRITSMPYPQERLVLRVGQAFWKGGKGGPQVIEEGRLMELVIGLIVDGRLWALHEVRGEQYPDGLRYIAVPIIANSDPYAQVTLVDVHYGWRWKIEYRMHQFPVDLREKTRLVPLRR